LKDNFKFYIPDITIKKAKASDGGDVQEMILEGLAGDGTQDTANESLTYNGFDLDRMFYINWEHSKDPDDVIGVILKKQLQKGGKLFIKGKLFNGHPKAISAYKLQEFLEKEGHNLGFSVEGKVLERDPINPKVVTKAELYGVALCKVPVNPVTYARIAKAFTGEEGIEEEEEENEEVKKMTTGDMAPAMPESVEKKPKKVTLTKSQVYSDIFRNKTTNPVLADSIFNNLIKPIAKMNGTPITEDVLQKAYAILDLAGNSASDELKKGADMNVGEDTDGGKIEELKKSMKNSKKEYLEKAKAYADMCKAKGMDPEEEEDEDEGEEEMEKNYKSGMMKKGFDVDIIKSAVSEAIGEQLTVLDEIKKSIEVRTMALGAVIKADKDQISLLSEELAKANETIALIQEYNEDFRTRLNMVEKTPIRKAVQTQSFVDRFEEKRPVESSNVFNINNRADREKLAKSVEAVYGVDLNNEKNYKVMEAVSTLQMTGTVLPEQQMLLKSEGYELVAL
jgi:hypothetical protein